MRYSKLTMLIPYTLLLSACTTITPAYEDNGPRTGSRVQEGPGSVAQQFYDYRIQHHGNDITTLRLYLSDKLAILLSDASRDNSHHELLSSDPSSSQTILLDSAHVTNASTIPNHDVRNVPLRVDLKQSDQGQQDEMLMIQRGQYWVIDDVHYLGDSVHTTVGTLRQSIGNRQRLDQPVNPVGCPAFREECRHLCSPAIAPIVLCYVC